MTRGWVLLAAALALAWAAEAGAQPRGQKAQKADRQKLRRRTSFRFTSIWQKARPTPAAKAAASGSRSRVASTPVRPAARQRLPQRHAARKLPVYFHSPGGERAGLRLRSGANCDSWGSPSVSVRPSRVVARRPVTTAAACTRGEAVAAAGRWRNGVPTPPATPPACGRCSAARSGTCRRRLALESIPARLTLTRQVVRRPRAAGFAQGGAAHKARMAEAVANARRYIARDGHRHGADGCVSEDTA